MQIRDGQVFIDVTDPSAEVIRPELFASLNAAMDDLDIGRLARDAMRLQRIGTPLADVIREGVRYAAPRAEYGWDHSLATLTDCLRMSHFFAESLRALPVIQGLSVAAENQVRRPDRPRPDPIDPVLTYGSIEAALAAYPVLVDEERANDAEALLRGLIAARPRAGLAAHAAVRGDRPFPRLRPFDDLRAEGVRDARPDRLAGGRHRAVAAGARDGAGDQVRQAAVHAQVPASVGGRRA